jgi:hypothetical protein
MTPTKWKNYQGALIPDSPPHHNVTLSSQEQKHLLKKSGAYFLRWTSDFDIPDKSSFWYIIKDSTPSLEELSANTRSKVRRGLKNCCVEHVEKEIIIHEGYEVYLKAFNRYTTFQQPLILSEFQESLFSLDGMWDFWSVRNKQGTLIAYSQNHLQEKTCNYSTIKFDPGFLSLYPAYALFYTMNDYYLNTLKLDYVHDGARSIAHQSNIHDFLCDKFNFRKAYCHLNITYRFDVALLIKIGYPLHFLIDKIQNNTWKMFSAILRQEKLRRDAFGY